MPSSPSRTAGAGPAVTVVVPTYNERDNLPPLLDAVRCALHGWPLEIWVVDDDSPDGTWRVAQRYGDACPAVRLLRRTGERGLGSAVIAGFDRARGDVLVVMDGDLSHDPAILPRLAQAVEAGADVAVGSRRIPGGGAEPWPWHRRRLSDLATALARVTLAVPLADPMSGYFALRRGVFEAVRARIRPRGYKILLEIVCRAGPLRIVEVPYVFRDRRQGVSKASLRVGLQYLESLWALRRESVRWDGGLARHA